MPSLRLLSILAAAAFSATAHASGSITVINKCSFAINTINTFASSPGQSGDAVAAGASSPVYTYGDSSSDYAHIHVWTGTDVDSELVFEAAGSLQQPNGVVTYDVYEGDNGNPFGTVFTAASSSDSSCPSLTGADDISPPDVASGTCANGADLTFTVCA
ncbi:hypothetical protein IWZ01DRAFT_333825 [Phyllosticta capitalensis]